MDSCLSGRQAPVRIKDKQYYKKLLDRYFGHNHALANENNSSLDKTIYRSKRNLAGRGVNSKTDINRQFPHVRLSYSSNDRKVVLTHEPFVLEDSDIEEVLDDEVRCFLVAFNQRGAILNLSLPCVLTESFFCWDDIQSLHVFVFCLCKWILWFEQDLVFVCVSFVPKTNACCLFWLVCSHLWCVYLLHCVHIECLHVSSTCALSLGNSLNHSYLTSFFEIQDLIN